MSAAKHTPGPCRYVLVERGEHVTRKGRFPFTHYFKEAGPFYNVATSTLADAAKFSSKRGALRAKAERGLRKYAVECAAIAKAEGRS